MDFKEWVGDQKPWKAGKEDIVKYWQYLPNNMPLNQVRSIPADYKGRTYFFDGLRLTGSSAFITAVISRLKDLLGKENEHIRLNLIYKQQINKEGEPVPDCYVFYVQSKERRPKKDRKLKPLKPGSTPTTL